MSDDNKPLDVQLLYNQRVVIHNKLQGMHPIDLSAPWANSLQIIALSSLKYFKG